MAHFLKIIVPTLGCVFLVITFMLIPSKHSLCTNIAIDKGVLCVEVVTTDAAIRKGLGGRESVGEYDGMLFRMPNTLRYSFWMKDMQFPIDIVWINAESRVTEITYNLTPETYPLTFRPQQPVRTVLEVPAGVAHPSWIGTRLTVSE